jgi:digeranylgeranylglycerophospholipid reductase
MEQIDVLVIGLGPAGGSAAAAAAKAGASVLVVERKNEIGIPVQCAEFIPLPLSVYAQVEGILVQRILAMNTLLPSGTVEQSKFPGLMIDRAAFDQALAREAQAHGACLLLGSRLRWLDAENKQAAIETPEGERNICYRVLVAADGPHSFVAAALSLPALEVVHTRQYTVPLERPHTDTDIWLSDAYPGGYAWLFPKGQVANLGLGLDKQFTDDLKTPLDRLHRQLVDEGLVGSEILARTGGAIPVSGMRERLVVGNVLFVGDAAGLTHPITGAGIAAAVVSGECAGEAAAAWLAGDHAALAEYEEDIRDQFGTTLARAVAKRQWMKSLWRIQQVQHDEFLRQCWVAFPEYFG